MNEMTKGVTELSSIPCDALPHRRLRVKLAIAESGSDHPSVAILLRGTGNRSYNMFNTSTSLLIQSLHEGRLR